MDHVDPPGRHPGERRKVGGRASETAIARLPRGERRGGAPEVVEGLVCTVSGSLRKARSCTGRHKPRTGREVAGTPKKFGRRSRRAVEEEQERLDRAPQEVSVLRIGSINRPGL